MSIYATAIIGTVDMLTGASVDAAYNAAYGTAYQSYARMHNAANAKVAAEANIAAIKQDKINTDKVIAMQQDQAAAQKTVEAAASGTEGGSFDATIYQTQVQSAVAKDNTRKQAEQSIEQQLATVFNAQSTMLAVDDPQVADIDAFGNTIAALSTFTGDEFGALAETATDAFAGIFDPVGGNYG